ncbi:hypothetical protein ACQP2P_22705 [Dactylosporangium sp. CA-139114]
MTPRRDCPARTDIVGQDRGDIRRMRTWLSGGGLTPPDHAHKEASPSG